MNVEVKKVSVHRPVLVEPVIHEWSVFRFSLRRETCRTDRNGKSFCLVVFRPGEGHWGRIWRREFQRRLLQERRAIDEVGLLDDGNVGVILPATTRTGAEHFADRVSNRSRTGRHWLSYVLYSYPENRLAEFESEEGVHSEGETSWAQRVKLILLVALWVASAEFFFGCINAASIPAGSASDARIVFTTSDPALHAVAFPSSGVSLSRGAVLMLATTNGTLAGLSGWEWYVDNVQDVTQTTASFNWDSGGKQPGQYIINVAVVYAGVKYSGSLRVTVTY